MIKKLTRSLKHTNPIRGALLIYASYRALLSSALFVLYWHFLKEQPAFFLADVYFYTTLGYVFLAYGSLPLIWKGLPSDHFNAYLTILTDIIFITLIMHSTGGPDNRTVVILLVTIAAANVIFKGRQGVFFAAVGSIALFYEFFFYNISQQASALKIGEIGLFGASFFIISFLTQQLAKNAKVSEALAEARALKIASLEQLNEHIIQRMRTGILVANEQQKIILHNKSAEAMLQTTLNNRGLELTKINPQLAEAFTVAKQQTHHHAKIKVPGGPDVKASFTKIDSTQNSELGGATLIFLEDIGHIQKEAQQLKLASLGKLTASIAHEIRNPLGAISHASQLLIEDLQEQKQEQRLAEIIVNHTERVNALIESILNLSRRHEAIPTRLTLNQFVSDFLRAYHEQTQANVKIKTFIDSDIVINFDKLQLQQVLSNLLDNARSYCGIANEDLCITISAGIDNRNESPYLDISDNGLGIDVSSKEHLFEPFFTTHSQGTGLGLYLCQELCQANLAHIDLVESSNQNNKIKACFRIYFAHPQRKLNHIE